ncbi:MAG: hypothetical protein WB621_15525 [Candidatus Acidiferrales bacterium]
MGGAKKERFQDASIKHEACSGDFAGANPQRQRLMRNMPEEKRKEKETALAAEVESLLPDFVNSCRDKAAVIVIHQDAFAADYQDDEYVLLGKAIKFAGLHGKEVHIIGKNRETLKGASKPELLQ